MDKKTMEQLELKSGGNNKEYKIETIYNSTVYTKGLQEGYTSGFYYLVS